MPKFVAFCSTVNPDIICVVRTWLCENVLDSKYAPRDLTRSDVVVILHCAFIIYL